ncbi:hypothetical protein D9M68_847260 [compost metagenome]
MAGEEDEQDPREKLDQTDQAQVEHIAGERVQLPADGHGEHLEAAGGADPGQPEGDEGALVAQEQLGVDAHGLFR